MARKVWGYRLCLDWHEREGGTTEMVFRLYTPMEAKVNGYSIWYSMDKDCVFYENGKRKRRWTITDPLTGMRICSIKATGVTEMLIVFADNWFGQYVANMKRPTEMYTNAMRKFDPIRKYLDGYEAPNKHNLCKPDTEIPFEMEWETLSTHYHGKLS